MAAAVARPVAYAFIFLVIVTRSDEVSVNQVETTKAAASRRSFLTAGSGLALGFAIVPRSVLGGAGYIAPSERINVDSRHPGIRRVPLGIKTPAFH
jgi:hypothetical protein